jgi:hypothetical protein
MTTIKLVNDSHERIPDIRDSAISAFTRAYVCQNPPSLVHHQFTITTTLPYTNKHPSPYPPLPKTSQLFPRTPVRHPLAITYHGHTLGSKQTTNINTTLKHYSHHVRQRMHEDWFWLDRQGARISFPTLPSSPQASAQKRLTGRKTSKQLTYLFALIENSNVKFDYNVRSQCPHFPLFRTSHTTPRLATKSTPTTNMKPPEHSTPRRPFHHRLPAHDRPPQEGRAQGRARSSHVW